VAVVQEAKYLGSYATRAGTDLRDVEERISKARRSTEARTWVGFPISWPGSQRRGASPGSARHSPEAPTGHSSNETLPGPHTPTG
jgi:hypothetical protein